MSEGFQAWLVEVATGELVGGPVDAVMSYSGKFHAADPLILTKRDVQTVVKVCVSLGEQSVWEYPCNLNLIPQDTVWLNKPGESGLVPKLVEGDIEMWGPRARA